MGTPPTAPESARFGVGELVQLLRFGYRGVVFDVDPEFRGSEDWYEQVARSRPPKDKPWYHVLPHDAQHTTYVAERNLEPDPDPQPIRHPLVEEVFDGFEDGHYVVTRNLN